MIRLIQRRLIVPRGDTGTFSIPVLAGKDSGDTSIFTIFSPLTHKKIFEKVMENSDGVLKMDLTHGDTVNLPVGEYVWDIKFYTNPVFVDEKLVSGTEVDSYYSAFQLPICEIRETGDNLLMADDAPDSKLAPDQINYIDAAIIEIHNSMNAAVTSAAEASTSATSAETSASAAAVSEAAAQDSQEAALASQQAAQAAASDAANSAATASQKAAQIEADLATKADKSEIPTLVSQLQNDAGYLNQETDPTVPAWAKAQTKPTYTAQEVGALPNDTFIPTRISDLTDDSGHYTKPVSGIPASDLAAGVLDVWSGLTYHTSTMSTDSDSFVLGEATDAPTEINKCLVTPTPVANVIPKFDYQGRLHSVTPEEEWDGSNAVATTEYVDNMISDNMPEIPTNVSELNNDAGYLTQHQDISGKANVADLATIATSGSYNDLLNKPTIPTAISQLTDDSGHYTKPANGIPATDMTSGVQTSLGLADTAYQKPNNGIPASDLASGVIPSVPVQDVQIKNTSILNNGIANIPLAANGAVGLVQGNNTYGTAITAAGDIMIYRADDSAIKNGNGEYKPIVPYTEHQAVFYGLAKAAGDTTQRESQNNVGIYTSSAQSAIQTMLDVPSNAAVTSAISTAIGNVHQFDIQVVQSLPTQDIQEHTVYFVPKTGEMNDVYDEYIYVNNGWEMIGNTQIDLSNYATKNEIPEVPVQDVQVNGTSVLSQGVANVPVASSSALGVVKVGSYDYGLFMDNGQVKVGRATPAQVKKGTDWYRPITPYIQNNSVFYGLAKAAGDTTQSQSDNAVGTYTTEAKAAIQQMLDVPSTSDILFEKGNGQESIQQKISNSSFQNQTEGMFSFTVGILNKAFGMTSIAQGLGTITGNTGSHSAGEYTAALGEYTHTEGQMTLALGKYSYAQGIGYGSNNLKLTGEKDTITYISTNMPVSENNIGNFIVYKNKYAQIISVNTVNNTVTLSSSFNDILEDEVCYLYTGYASGVASHVEGFGTIANGLGMHSQGAFNTPAILYPEWTKNTQYIVGDRITRYDYGYECIEANSDSAWISSKWRLIYSNSNSIFTIGNGTGKNNRSNALSIDIDGNEYLMGNIYVGANADSTGGTKVLCEADFATDLDIQTIINGGAGA